MARPPAIPPQEKVRIVLAVLAGEQTVAQAARLARVSEQSIANWRRQFIEGGTAKLKRVTADGPTLREEQLLLQVRQLKAALGEAYVELMALRKLGAERRPGTTVAGVPARR